ncbi:MAG: GxxExxY protein [Spartobacteria bacterium]
MNKIIRMEEEEAKTFDICGQIIGAAMKVHSTLGPGFLESVYQNALIWELRKLGIKAEAERAITVRDDGQIVGAFTADILVNDSTIVELKAGLAIAKVHEVQLVNYLVATGLDEGVLLNFGAARLEFKKKLRLPKQAEEVSF